MGTSEQYADWIVKNQDKKGTPEFNTVAEAYKASKTSTTPEDTAKDVASSAVAGINTIAPSMAGMPMDTVQNAANLLIAGYGYAKGKLTGSTDLPELIGGLPFGSEDIKKRITKAMGGDPFSPVKDTPLQQNIHMGASILGAGLVQPASSIKQLATNVARMAPSAAGGVAAKEAFPDQPLAPLAGMLAGPVAWGAVKGTVKGTAHYLNEVTKPLDFFNGIERDVNKFLVNVAGKEKGEIINALRVALRTESKDGAATVSELLAKASKASGGRYGDQFIKLEQELSKQINTGAPLRDIYASAARDRVEKLFSFAGTEKDLANAESVRKANANTSYSELDNIKVDARSNVEILQQKALQAADSEVKAYLSKAEALRDWGRFKTLEGHQAARSVRKPPEIGPLEERLTGRTQSSMGDIPGQPRIPPRYTPQRAVQNEASIAAEEAKLIAYERLTKEQGLNEVNRIMLLHTVGEGKTSFNTFLQRPSVQKAVESARNNALETGGYWPTKPGEQFTAGNLARIKRGIAENLEVEKTAGTLKRSDQAAIAKTMKSFTGWLSKKVPEFKDAEKQYIQDSVPINQMKIGQELMNALVNSVDNQTPIAYTRALREIPKTIKKATKFSWYKSLDQVLTPDQVKIASDIGEGLVTLAKQNKMAGGVESVLKELPSEISSGLAPSILWRPAVMMNFVLKVIQKNKSPEYKRVLTEKLSDPQKLIDVLSRSDSNPEKKIMLDVISTLTSQINQMETIKQDQ